MGGIKTKYQRHNGLTVGWTTSFVGDYFFILGWVFFFGLTAKKKKISPTNEIIFQWKHHYPYNNLFLWFFFVHFILKRKYHQKKYNKKNKKYRHIDFIFLFKVTGVDSPKKWRTAKMSFRNFRFFKIGSKMKFWTV